MEFRYRSEEESKSWSEESEDGLWERDEGSGIRSYECVFCKRGFTTAQALGGHMNIHRKHRASSSSSASPNHNKSINNPNNNFPSNSSIHISNSSSTILLDATDDTTTITTTNLDLPFYSPISTPPPHPYNNYHQFSINPSTAPLPPNPITSNQRGLSLYQTNIHKVADQYCSEEDGLDLELRLGYHP